MTKRARTGLLVVALAWNGAACRELLNPFENACTPATAVSLAVASDSLLVGHDEVMVASAASDPEFFDFPLCPFSWRTSDPTVVALSGTAGSQVYALARAPGVATVTVVNNLKSASTTFQVK